MTVTRSSNQGDLQYDPEIERTLCRLRRKAWRISGEHDLARDSLFASDFDLEEDKVMAENKNFERACCP